MSWLHSADPALTAQVAAILGLDGVRMRGLARGVTHETLLVDAGGGPMAVLRLSPPGSAILPRHGPADEARILSLLEDSGVPVPRVLAVDDDGTRFGRAGFLMTYCEGRSTMTWKALRAETGSGTAADALGVLARIHALDVPPAWPDAHAAADHAFRDLEGVRRLASEAGGRVPDELPAALEALEAEPPSPSGAGVVHGDYRPANMMAADGRVTGVLDWEMTTVGDPACDFGISTMPEWGTWWPDEELLERYHALQGCAIERASLLWWRSLGYAKVTAFLARRAADGWAGGPVIRPWAAALAAATAAWGAS